MLSSTVVRKITLKEELDVLYDIEKYKGHGKFNRKVLWKFLNFIYAYTKLNFNSWRLKGVLEILRLIKDIIEKNFEEYKGSLRMSEKF